MVRPVLDGPNATRADAVRALSPVDSGGVRSSAVQDGRLRHAPVAPERAKRAVWPVGGDAGGRPRIVLAPPPLEGGSWGGRSGRRSRRPRAVTNPMHAGGVSAAGCLAPAERAEQAKARRTRVPGRGLRRNRAAMPRPVNLDGGGGVHRRRRPEREHVAGVAPDLTAHLVREAR